MSLNGLEALFPFITAAYTMWVTPGPNNMMLAYSGARFGVLRTLPHICGIVGGTVLLNTMGILDDGHTGIQAAGCAIFLWI